jgi:hypothetical protein
MKRPIGQKSTSHEFTIWFHAAITAEIVSGRRSAYWWRYTRRAVGMILLILFPRETSKIRKTTSLDDTCFCVSLFGFTEIFNPRCTRLFECGANRIAMGRGSARGLSPRRGLGAAAGY